MEIYQYSQSNQERSAGIHQDRSGVRASLHAMEDAEAVSPKLSKQLEYLLPSLQYFDKRFTLRWGCGSGCMSGSGMESMAGQALGKDSEQDGVPDDCQHAQKCSLERRCLRRTDTHFKEEVQHDNGKTRAVPVAAHESSSHRWRQSCHVVVGILELGD
jgi:hypothetical protein